MDSDEEPERIDIYYAFRLYGTQKRAFHAWLLRVELEAAAKDAWKEKMAGVLTATVVQEEKETADAHGIVPITPVTAQRRRLKPKYSPTKSNASVASVGGFRKTRDGLAGGGGGDDGVEQAAIKAWNALRSWRLLRIWQRRCRERRRRQEAVHRHLAVMLLGRDGRKLERGMAAFKAKAPSWQKGISPADCVISADGYWVGSKRHQERLGVHGSPSIESGVYRFAFRLHGTGQGAVVGVSDASVPGQPPDLACAWGLHLTTGALYTKVDSGHRGTLSTQQLLANVLDADFLEGEPTMNVVDIEIMVDMTRSGGGRIALGLPGGVLVEAPVVLTKAVRPWSYLWNDSDSVALDTRPKVVKHKSVQLGMLGSQYSSVTASSTGRPGARVDVLWLRDRLATTRAADIASAKPAGSARRLAEYLPMFLAAPPGTPGYLTSSRLLYSPKPKSQRSLLSPKPKSQRSSPSRAPSPSPTAGRMTSARSPVSDMPSPGRSPGRSPRLVSPRSSRGRALTHMWDSVRHVSHTYTDLPKQLKQGPNVV